MADELSVGIDDVREAARRLEGVAHRTPVHRSGGIDEMLGVRVVFKCENFQRVGAFKFRGAYNAISRLSDEDRAAGVLAYSSGNHAQAVALASRLLGVPATIVMPTDAPKCKLDATRGYLKGNGEVMLYDRADVTREELADQMMSERKLTLIPPFDHPHVIAGQGTAALELFESVGELDYLFVPCGGGGLISGCATVAKALCPSCKVVGVEPQAGDDAVRSFQTGTLQAVADPQTIADGARTPSLGTHTFRIVLSRVDHMLAVSDEELIAAMRVVWERVKIVIEPTAALGFAGLIEMTRKDKIPQGSRVGVVLSGGNVDLDALGAI